MSRVMGFLTSCFGGRRGKVKTSGRGPDDVGFVGYPGGPANWGEEFCGTFDTWRNIEVDCADRLRDYRARSGSSGDSC